jgi:hypothetical protein
LVDWAACKWGCESVRFVITLECHFLLALWCFCSILCPVVQSVLSFGWFQCQCVSKTVLFYFPM